MRNLSGVETYGQTRWELQSEQGEQEGEARLAGRAGSIRLGWWRGRPAGRRAQAPINRKETLG